MTFKLFTSISIAAMTTVFSITALAQGGDDPIEGIDIIIKRDPSSQPIKPFSLNYEEIKQINAIKGVGRMELILKAAAKRTKTQDGFVKSGMGVMGKDWCGECAWPEKANYTFKNGDILYTLDLKYRPMNTYGATRSNRSTGEGIAAPSGCVTESGAKDVNCDGVGDAAKAQTDARQKQLKRETVR